MKKQILLIGVLLCGVLAAIYFVKNQSKDQLFVVMDVPEFEFANQDNQIITPKELLGKVYVVEFFFTNCPTICPVMNQNLIKVESEINSPDFGIISITIDPKRDTPEVLKKHKQHLGIHNPNWHFLSADRESIYSVSKKFNIFMGKDESSAEGLEHSGKMALVDKNGKIRSRYNASGIPILYYSGINYEDPKGKTSSLTGKYHPEMDMLKEDIKVLLNQ